MIAYGRALDLLALHGHALGHLLLGQRRTHALLDDRLVLKDLIDDIPRRQLLVVFNLLGNGGFDLGERYGRVGAVLLGDLLDHARHRVDDLLTRNPRVALQQAVGNEHAILAGNLALLIHIADLHGACTHDGIARHLLRGVWQNGVVARDVVTNLALFATHLVHECLLGAQQHHGKPAGIFIIVKVRHKHVSGLGFLGLGEFGRDELRNLLRQVHELTLTKEIALELAAKRRVLRKRGALIVGRGTCAAQMRGHKTAHGTAFDIQLALAHDVDGRVKVQDMQNRVIDFHIRHSVLDRFWHEPV